ncbi:hypothetical protein B0H21DRAFT_687894 [Amylocystis lapponica]|nr:hypothetical protein B0H21DRAFT_687894 [Amylocystis lapponica]
MQALAAEPWEAPTFFRTPIDTLLESTEDISFDNISHHDLSDAYNTFSLRLRTITKAMTEREGTLPALGLVKQHATAITKCLRRDIRLALIDPFPEPPPANIAIPNSITSSTRDITDEEMEAARDYASVSHSALHLTANVFKFATFSACFPHDDVCALLDCVIEIALDPALPTPSSRKTTALAVWVLGNSHRLQGPLSQRRHRLTRALGRIIVSTGPTITVIDALKTVFNILVAQPALFLDPFGALVPQILDCLISPTPSIRIQAAHTLSGFVLALTQCTNNGARKAVYEHVQTFLDYQLSFRRKQSSGTLRLGDLISAALSSEQPRDPGQGAPWALVVLACVVVFSGSSIFTHPRALKLVIHSLTKTATHRRSVVRTLHASLWKCLVWAFANIGQNNRSKEEADAAKETREPAFLVVKQELVGGVGAVLVSSLLSHYVLSRQPDDAELTKALIVVKDMVKHESSTIHAEGVSILTRLISSIGCSSPDPSRSSTSDTSPEFKILTKELFDGTILTSPWERLSTLAPTFCKFDLENIRQLCEAEIERRWEDLISIWVICVQRSLSAHTSAAPLSTDLLHVWQALLLVQTQLTQERGHLTTPPEFASRAVAIIDILLAMTKPDVPGSSHVGDTQRSVLTLTLQLWKIMKNVFAASWLTPTAGSILMVVFKREYVLEREDVKIAWSELCAALIRSNAPGLLSTLDVSDDHQGEQEIRRHVWRTLADRWSKFYKPSWQDTVSLLVFPFGSWDMSDRELAVWDGIVGYATSQADSSLLVIEALVSRIVETSERLSAYPKPILALLSHIRLTDVDDISAKLLGHLDKFLLDIYSTDSELSHLRSTMLPAFSTMFALCPPSKLVQIIAALSRGLCIWINDKLLVFSDDGYNDTVMTFYRDTLKLLRDHTLTLDTLHVLAPFFTSAFVRVPPPALGPVAFMEFWGYIQPGLGCLEGALPEEIKTCLNAYHLAFDGVLLPDISMESQSQSQRHSQSQSQFQSSVRLVHMFTGFVLNLAKLGFFAQVTAAEC